ncbi:hypothetical protein FGIG_01475 [Fasciola gigantica]|uniref:Uncharacterized protein n=1 Tax=Fasciola gigantica TaxID=46835 RepID=A0A504YHF4_FASGI|nr:hypothetical protein FGIG_01475 [Fasciola gigantica]
MLFVVNCLPQPLADAACQICPSALHPSVPLCQHDPDPFEGIIHDLISAVNQVMLESLVNHLLASSACGDHKNGHLPTQAHDFTKAQNETANYFGLSATHAIDAKSKRPVFFGEVIDLSRLFF